MTEFFMLHGEIMSVLALVFVAGIAFGAASAYMAVESEKHEAAQKNGWGMEDK